MQILAARAAGLRARPVERGSRRGLLISRSLALLNIRANHIPTKHAAHGAPFNIDGKALPGSRPRRGDGVGPAGFGICVHHPIILGFKGLIHTYQ